METKSISEEYYNGWWNTLSAEQRQAVFTLASKFYYCEDCKKFVKPVGLGTHEVSCPFCGFYFGCDD